jgi:hypothetical protein
MTGFLEVWQAQKKTNDLFSQSAYNINKSKYFNNFMIIEVTFSNLSYKSSELLSFWTLSIFLLFRNLDDGLCPETQ